MVERPAIWTCLEFISSSHPQSRSQKARPQQRQITRLVRTTRHSYIDCSLRRLRLQATLRSSCQEANRRAQHAKQQLLLDPAGMLEDPLTAFIKPSLV